MTTQARPAPLATPPVEAEAAAPSAPLPKNLGRATMAAGIWLTVARWIVRAAHILTVVLLARLLLPVEYGLVALAKVLSNLVLLGSFGLQAAVIQREGEVSDRVMDVAWTYDRLIFNVGLGIVVFFAAPFAASFFHEPSIVDVVRALALVPIIQGLENNAFVVLTRELEYKKRFFLEGISGVAMLVVAVPLALILRNVWAFVIAYLVGLLARSALSYALYPKVPRLRFDPPIFKDLFGFGKWMIALKLITTAREQAAAVVLGRISGATMLGYFQIGGRFSAQLGIDLTQTARKVLFPVYSRIQSDTDRVVRGYLRILELTWTVLGPFSALLALLAWPTTQVVFGRSWLPAAPLMQIMCIVVFVKTTTAGLHPVLRGRGKPGIETGFNVLWIVTALPLLIGFALEWGITGATWALVIAELVQVPFWVRVSQRELGIGPAMLARRLLAPALLTACTVLTAWAVLGPVRGWPPVLQLAIAGGAGGVAYLAVLLVGARVFGIESFRAMLDRVIDALPGRRRAAKKKRKQAQAEPEQGGDA